MTLEERVTHVLKELGQTKKEVANSLRRLGIKGRRDALSCPIHRYLKRRIRRKGVRQSSTISFGTLFFTPAGAVNANHPRAVRAFIRAFDRLEFPDLVQR